MPKLINLFLLGVGILACGVGMAKPLGRLESTVMLGLGIGLVALAWISDRRRQTRAGQQQRRDADKRIAELTRVPWRVGQTLQVRGSLWAGVCLMMLILIGGWMLRVAWHESIMSWKPVLGGGFLLALGLLLLPRELAGLGKPALELDSRGFSTPVHGWIAWREVSGIHLSAIVVRGRTSYNLLFRVERFAQVATKIHWSERLLAVFRLGALARGTVGVPLRDSREQPETVRAAARFLWKQATGNDYEWNPSWSEQANQALKRSTMLASSLADPQAMEQLLRDDSGALRQQLDANAKDIAVLVAERKRQLGRIKWMSGLLLLAMLLLLAWPWVRSVLLR